MALDLTIDQLRIVEVAARDVQRQVCSIRHKQGHRPSLWSRLRLAALRSALRMTTEHLCATVQSERSHLTVEVRPSAHTPNWTVDEIGVLHKHGRAVLSRQSHDLKGAVNG